MFIFNNVSENKKKIIDSVFPKLMSTLQTPQTQIITMLKIFGQMFLPLVTDFEIDSFTSNLTVSDEIKLI